MVSIYWLIAFVILIGIEITTMMLTTIWFAGGALVAFFLSLLGVGVKIQIVAFIAVSFVLLLFTRPLATKLFNKNTTKTNAEGLVEKKARVTVEINNDKETGAAIVNGQEWTARSVKDEVIIQPGTMVRIEEISGVKLMVSQEQEEA